jgi:hypothetical protein
MGYRTLDLPVCSIVPEPLRYRVPPPPPIVSGCALKTVAEWRSHIGSCQIMIRTNSIYQRLCWIADERLGGQGIPRHIWNPPVYYLSLKRPCPERIEFGHIPPTPAYFSKIRCIRSLCYHSLIRQSSLARLPVYVQFSSYHECCMPLPRPPALPHLLIRVYFLPLYLKCLANCAERVLTSADTNSPSPPQ